MVSSRIAAFAILIVVPLASTFLFDDASNVQNLLQLITDEKQMRSSLEYELQSLKHDIAAMKARHKSSKSLVICLIIFYCVKCQDSLIKF